MAEATHDRARPWPLSRRAALFGIAGAGLGAVGVWRAWPWIMPLPEGAALSVAEAHAAAVAGEILLIDIRTPGEWARTGVGEGARPLDMRRPDFVDALRRLAGRANDRPVAVICARGVRSARLAERLAEAGFGEIVDVPEGMLGSRAGPGWIAAGLPVRDWAPPEG